MDNTKVALRFAIYKGDQLIRTETLTRDISKDPVIKIGKLSSSHLKVDDENVSRMHAVIEITGPGEIFIIDLGSTKGTFVNGQKVNKAKLQSGDELLLGDTRVVLTIGDEASLGAESLAVGDTKVDVGPASPPPRAPEPPPVQVAAMAPPPPAPAAAPSYAQAPSFAQPPAASVPSYAAPSYAQAPMSIGPSYAQVPIPEAAPVAFEEEPEPDYAPMPTEYVDVEKHDGSKAVEVTTVFDKTVVETRHLPSDSAKMSSNTWAMLASGMVMFLASIVVYGALQTGVHEWGERDAKRVKDNKDRVSRGQKENPVEDSPLGPGWAFLFVLFGVGSLGAGVKSLLDDRKVLGRTDYFIGEDPLCDLHCSSEGLPAQMFPLVKAQGADFVVSLTPSMAGDVSIDGKITPIKDIVGARGAVDYPLPLGARCKIDLGQLTFLVNSVPPPKRPVGALFGSVDWAVTRDIGVSFVAHALLLFLIYAIPPDAKSLAIDLFGQDSKYMQFVIKPPEQQKEELPDWLKKNKSDDTQGGKGQRHKFEEGKMGKKTSKNKEGLYGLKGPKDNQDPHLAKKLAEEQARNAGILGMLKAQTGSHIASVFGRDSALGSDAENVLGGLTGSQIGEAQGFGGLGLVGTGRGGGGTGEGTIGLDRLGTIGKGGGGGTGGGYGRGAGGLGGRRAGAPTVVAGSAVVRGSLDKETIRRIIRRHINEVKYCYEKELVSKPKLNGKVTIAFVIAPTGAVQASSVAGSSMGSSAVEGCIAAAVRRWTFPAPKGGGIVQVSYPFVLNRAGQ